MSNEPIEKSQVLFYQTEDGRQRVEVRLDQGTVWLSQKEMAEIFQTTPQNINIHLKNIFADGEVHQNSVMKEALITASDGKRYRTQLYCLEAIMSVGYRVSSHRGMQFRQWATMRLREYVVKGFTLDDERLSNPGGMVYFDELLDRIRAIRASQKHFYQKMRDIYMLSADYDPQHEMTEELFKTIQNKLLYAVTGLTAPEIIRDRVSATSPHLGLTTWDGMGRGKKWTKQDIETAKNYLNYDELKNLEQLVSQYLDFAERQARSQKVMYMADWKAKFDAFLQVNDEKILTHAASISEKLANELAFAEYAKFEERQRDQERDLYEQELQSVIQKVTFDRESS